MIVWRAGQVVGVAALIVLLVGLVAAPMPTRILFWNVVVPILPLTFLVSPMIWRNLCPLATLNVVGGGRRVLRADAIPAASAAGILLLLVMVALRRIVFNQNGPLLEIVLALVVLSALVSGLFFSVKAGFCNSVCPVLPVERLYGQHPAIHLPNPRCRPCTLCTERGCIDLEPTLAMPQALGPGRRTRAWLGSADGIFAASFPGFVLGYGLTADVPFMGPGNVLARLLLWPAVSYAAVALLVVLTRASSRAATTLCGGAAVAIYYWFAAPVMAWAVGAPRSGFAFRAAFLAVVALWLARAIVRLPRYGRPSLDAEAAVVAGIGGVRRVLTSSQHDPGR